MIPYGQHDINSDDIEAVVEVLRSNFITQGPMVPEFENVVLSYCNAKFAVAMNSATSALHAACLSLNLGVGDLFWTSPITFVASANCGLYCGAEVDFVDIDPVTYNISISALQKKLEQSKKEGRLPKILIVVHMCGQSCNMKEINELSKIYGFSIIEDASHAIGGKYRGNKIGNCEYSDITIFSFHPVKLVTSAEGGMAVTNDEELARKLRLIRSHGITRDASQMQGQAQGYWYYEQLQLGYNYRMNDLQAALGKNQMLRLDIFLKKRHALADVYNYELLNLPLITPLQIPDSFSAYHLYIIRLKLNSIKADRNRIINILRENGVGANVHYIPIHLQPYYRAFGFRPGDFPEAEKYYSEAITLPLFPSMSSYDQHKVIDQLKAALK